MADGHAAKAELCIYLAFSLAQDRATCALPAARIM